MVALADTWDELVTAGLLGTERRDPPELPAGLLADTVADAQRTTPQGRLLAAVAATVVAQRCGVTPLPRRPLLLPPDPDDRPLLPGPAVERWQLIVASWPVLEAEWLARAASGGCRPAPDLLVVLLRRHLRSPVLAGAVLAWGGAAAAWLVDHVPDLEPVAPSAAPPTGDVRPLPVPAELEPLLGAAADTLAAGLVDGLASGKFRWSHRAVLLNVVARMDATSLPTVIAALGRRRDALAEIGDEAAPLAIWEALLELATMRLEMLAELAP